MVQHEVELPSSQVRTCLNGLLVQDRNNITDEKDHLKVVTNSAPTAQEIEDLLFASKICKNTKSNTIVFAKNSTLVASGTGQTSRVDALKQAIEKATTLQCIHPDLMQSLSPLKFLYCVKGSSIDDATSYEWGKEMWANRHVAFSDKYVRKYFQGISPQVQITHGIFTSSVYNAQTLGHIYVELLQQLGKFDEAFAILHEMQPDQLVAISLADLEICTKDYDGAIETTEDIENEDDATAMMLILRGVAFREKGLNEGALECFKRALASKKRSEILLHRALFERAETYSALGKKSLAIKDLEKILVDDSDYPAVLEKLKTLKA